jgi:uncharacterized membrane protein YsdA (DUF1294 family)
MMGLDKGKAKRHEKRISERSIFIISLVGGFWGVLLGGILARHKTTKTSFQLVLLATTSIWLLGISQILSWGGCFS